MSQFCFDESGRIVIGQSRYAFVSRQAMKAAEYINSVAANSTNEVDANGLTIDLVAGQAARILTLTAAFFPIDGVGKLVVQHGGFQVFVPAGMAQLYPGDTPGGLMTTTAYAIMLQDELFLETDYALLPRSGKRHRLDKEEKVGSSISIYACISVENTDSAAHSINGVAMVLYELYNLQDPNTLTGHYPQ